VACVLWKRCCVKCLYIWSQLNVNHQRPVSFSKLFWFVIAIECIDRCHVCSLFIVVYQAGDTALHLAVVSQRQKIAKLLLDEGLSYKTKNKVGIFYISIIIKS